MATWEILSEGDVVETDEGQKQYLQVRVVLTCPDVPNPESEDGKYTFDQDVIVVTNAAGRQAKLDAYANDYESEYCASLTG